MKRVKKLICCTLFMMSPLFSVIVWANDEAVAEAEKLLDNLGMEEILEQSITQSLDFQVQKNPELVPYVGVMKAFLAKHMSYESLKDDIVNLYSTTFSVQELKDISAFYSTETGKKTLQKLPELARISNQLGSDRVQENIEELHQMLEGASKLVEESKQL
jgi:hypothetical protein